MTDAPRAASGSCPSCGAATRADARFCEACGTPIIAPAAQPVTPAAAAESHPLEVVGSAPISAPTSRPADALPDPPEPHTRRPCASCGGEVGPDLYCMECGTKAPSWRDHFREDPARWVAGVCDKGVGKVGNEDAMALLAAPEPGSRAVLVVLDGVSSADDSSTASLAGARAARDVLRLPLPSGMGTDESRAAAAERVFADAVRAANTAIVAATDPDSPNPASATFAAAVLEEGRVTHATVGDSRVYWLPDTGEPQLLTRDDSLAQAQIDAGTPREIAEASPQAHAITKWLGRDSEDPTPRVGTVTVTEPGWLVACTDGLWNYASEPADLREQVARAEAADAAGIALGLVAFANASGGHDNITVALARVGGLGHNATTGSVAGEEANADG